MQADAASRRGLTPVLAPMPDITWTSILTSSVIAAVIGGLLGGLVTLRVARNQYINDYYKLVVKKRIDAYEHVEDLITQLKTSLADDQDRKVYHFLFAEGDVGRAHKALFLISAQSMWLTDELVDETVELNRLLYQCPSDPAAAIAFTKEHYQAIAEARTRLERMHARDFVVLHKVKRFLKSKKPRDSYGTLPDRR
jgi:hypothetical protein